MINASSMNSGLAPRHIGFIMDGNRRWARGRGLPTFEGHRHGYEKMKEVGRWCLERGVENITVFAFSTENWRRSEEEVNYLMRLINRVLTTDIDEFNRLGLRLKIIGRRDGLSNEIQRAAEAAEQCTVSNIKGTLYVALNYGGRAEIIDAAKAILRAKVPPDDVDEASFAKFLYAPEAPDLDLIIRTSGEQRLSGFMLWHSVYSELYFITKHWPEFSAEDLDSALALYQDRHRRFGQ